MQQRISTPAEIQDRDAEIGIYRGLGWTNPEISEHIGISVKGVEQRLYGKQKERIRRFEIIARTAAAKRMAEIESKADIKAKIHRNAYRVIDKGLRQALQETKTVITKTGEPIEVPVEITMTHLQAVDSGLDRIEGKALDRKAILERREVIHRREIDEDALNRVLEQAQRLNLLRGGVALLPAAVEDDAQEAELVEPPN